MQRRVTSPCAPAAQAGGGTTASARRTGSGLSNRRRFEQAWTAELARAQRQEQPLGLVIVDIDHFKRINDRYGHPAGDRVLVEVAALLAACLRPIDMIARIGGEEFAVLAPGADADQARGIAERMRHALVQHSPLQVEHSSIPVTISAGVGSCRFNGSAQDIEAAAAEFYRSVDDALYAAKQGGRDRIETAGAPVRSAA